MPVGVYASPIGVRFVCLNISYSIWICLLLDLLRVVRNCSVPLVPEGDYRKFQMIRWVVALSWSIEIDRTFCFVDGWLSVLIHVLVHWWYNALFLCSGFFNGMSYYLSILGIGRWGFWPLGLPPLTGIYRSWGHFVLVVYIHFPNPLLCVHFSGIFVIFQLLFPRQTIFCELGVLCLVILFLMA